MIKRKTSEEKEGVCGFGACTTAVALVALAFPAFGETVPPLPPSAYRDTEISTNVAFAAGYDDVRIFTLGLELDASISNSVLVAFGRDDDGDGVLAREETSAQVGWDAGFWRYVDRRSGCEVTVPRTDDHRKLNWRLSLLPDKTAKTLTATDGEGTVFHPTVPRTLFDGSWNLMRVTARGLFAPSSFVVTETKGLGYQVIVR